VSHFAAMTFVAGSGRIPYRASPMHAFDAGAIGARVAQARKEAGAMTQPQLADLLDLSLRQVQNIEAGITVPYKHFSRLEEIFPGRTMGWFLYGGEATSEPDEALLADRLEHLEARLGRVEELARSILGEIRSVKSGRPEPKANG